MRKRKDKAKAIKLRRQGKTYNEISRQLGIPKGTLSSWFGGKAFSEKAKRENYSEVQKIWARNLIRYNKKRAEKAARRRERIKEEASEEVKTLSEENLRLIGAALYWAEGNTKNRNILRFSNSDPSMIKVIMRFFREICNVPVEKIKGRIHLYSGINQRKATNYWVEISGLPKENFHKPQIQVSRASKGSRPRNTLPYGTLHLTAGNTEVTCKVKGWIRGITRKI